MITGKAQGMRAAEKPGEPMSRIRRWFAGRGRDEAGMDQSLPARMEAANRASEARNWQLAAQLWDALRRDFPSEALGWSKAGEAYCEQGLLDEADRVLTEGMERSPGQIWIAYQYALVAQRRGDWPEALLRATRLQRIFADQAIGYLLRGDCLRELGRSDEAEGAFAEAVSRFPHEEWALYSFAQHAAHRRDWAEAASRWDGMLKWFPDHATAIISRGQALQELGRLDEAEAVFVNAIERFADNEAAFVQYACMASRRRDWNEALTRWNAVRVRFPNSELAETAIAEALSGLERDNPEDQSDPEQAVIREVYQRGIPAQLPERVADPEVFIEITSICNFACGYCVSPMKLRQKKHMPLETFRDVVAQVATITTKPVRLHIDGEPTSHPDFAEMARLANSHGLQIWLSTNGSLLDASYLDIWMDVLISLSTSSEELAKRHNKLDFESYIERVADYASAWSRGSARQNLAFQIIHYPQQNAAAEADYKERKNRFLVEFCRRAGLYETCTEESAPTDDSYRLRRKDRALPEAPEAGARYWPRYPGSVSFVKQPVSAGGLYPADGKMLARERATAGFCDAPWRQLVIHSNGSLGACCVDLSGGTTFADAAERQSAPIKELWQSGAAIKRLRQNFLDGRVERDVCQRCLTQGQVMFAPTSL